MKYQLGYVVPSIALVMAFGCSHPVPVLTPSGPLPPGPVGSWSGALRPLVDIPATIMPWRLNVAVTITQAGPTYQGDCSQSGTDDLPTVDREAIESFRLLGIDPIGQIVLLEGYCEKIRFTLAYNPSRDRIAGDWGDHQYLGELTRR